MNVWCWLLGHARGEWHPVVWVHESTNGLNGPFWTSNTRQESRYCRRCWHGLQMRDATIGRMP